MRAAILTEQGFELREVERPTPAADQVLIRTTACGVCSGDVYVYQHRATLAPTHSHLGHEGSGVIAAVGSQVSGVAVGDVVAALGMPAYADYYLTTPDRLAKLPPGADTTYVVGEAVACSVHASWRFGVRSGDNVAVIGCGFMGLLALQLAHDQGAGLLVAIDPIAERRAMSQRFGAAAVFDPEEADAADILAAHGEFDVVIEAVGAQSALDLGSELVTQHGRLILIGYHQSNGGMRAVNVKQWNWKGIDVINAHVRRQDEKAAALRRGMELLQQGRIVTEPLVTVYDFNDTERAFRELSARKPGLYKAVLVMEG